MRSTFLPPSCLVSFRFAAWFTAYFSVVSTLLLASCSSTTLPSSPSAPPACTGDACDSSSEAGTHPTPDASTDAGDLPFKNCRQLPSYPGGVTVGIYLDTAANAPPNDSTIGMLRTDDQGYASSLNVEVIHARAKLPLSMKFTRKDTMASCDACVTITEGCDGSSACKTVFLAQTGSMSVTQADKNATQGRVTASGSAIVFAEWDTAQDAPVPNGKCIEVTSVSLDAHWGSAGACEGASCSSAAQCCGAASYCIPVGGGHSICSSQCAASYGAGAGNCSSANDCCGGFKCFLGSCMDNTCIGKACTAGFGSGAGACCATAPYCTGDATGLKCRLTCGDKGNRCAADADCCTGSTCAGGTCS